MAFRLAATAAAAAAAAAAALAVIATGTCSHHAQEQIVAVMVDVWVAI